MPLTRRVFLAAVLGAAISACAHRTQVNSNEDTGPTQVRVVNQGYADMDIFVLSTGTGRIRLGTVTGNSTATFTLPGFLVGHATQVRFLADPIGSNRTPVSDQITVEPGETVELTIPPG